MRTHVLAVAVVLFAPGARAEDAPYGVIMGVKDLSVLPGSPPRLRVKGEFAVYDGAHYGAAIERTAELTCPADEEETCRTQWAAIVPGMCIGVGWGSFPPNLSTSGDGTALWVTARGVSTLSPEGAVCRDLSSVRPLDETKPPPKVDVDTGWYGGTMFALDGLAVATSPFLVGIGGYFLTPLMHVKHRNWSALPWSYGMRVTLPIGVAVALCRDQCNGQFGAIGYVVGAAVGALLAIVIDDAALAYDSRPPAKTALPRIAPTLMIDTRSIALGIVLF